MLLATAKKIIVLIIGGTLLGIGIAMIVLPGPAFIVIPIGLSILGTEFAWARVFIKRVQTHASNMRSHISGDKHANSGGNIPPAGK